MRRVKAAVHAARTEPEPPIEQKHNEVIVFGVSIGGILLGAIVAWLIVPGVT